MLPPRRQEALRNRVVSLLRAEGREGCGQDWLLDNRDRRTLAHRRRIRSPQPEFFDPRTSEPIVWYVDHGGTLELFDLMGYHPETSEELLPVTPVIADRWKAQQAPPTRVDPASHPWFDVK